MEMTNKEREKVTELCECINQLTGSDIDHLLWTCYGILFARKSYDRSEGK